MTCIGINSLPGVYFLYCCCKLLPWDAYNVSIATSRVWATVKPVSVRYSRFLMYIFLHRQPERTNHFNHNVKKKAQHARRGTTAGLQAQTPPKIGVTLSSVRDLAKKSGQMMSKPASVYALRPAFFVDNCVEIVTSLAQFHLAKPQFLLLHILYVSLTYMFSTDSCRGEAGRICRWVSLM